MKREDMHKYRVDFSDVEYFIQIHEALMRDLDFPDYYGGNLDALWDCLTDMLGDWADIELVGFEGVAKKFSDEWNGILRIFARTKHAYGDRYSDRFFVTLVYKGGSHEEIK